MHIIIQITFHISVGAIVDQHESAVAFHAELGQHKYNLTAGAIITFETIKQNYGNAYDPQTGIFTCPKSGLYFFAVTIMAYPGKPTQTKLVHNGSAIAYSYSAGTPNFYNTGSKSIIVALHMGDRVWLEFYDGYNPGEGPMSTLTGYFIL